MPELIELYWPYLLIALAVGIAVAWLIFVSNRKTSVLTDRRDVLDEGAERAQRNQALIDAAAKPVEAVPVPTPAAVTLEDDLTRIKGLGPKIATMLAGMGVTRFDHIAQWNDAEIDRIDAQLGRFSGRIRRDNWVAQAKLLAAGDEAGFAGTFGKEG
ncbi:hypothetical protein IM511_07350 [Erythrobacteraceae bacterium E2-1 Yellow Sea]|nr:hypothetical protein [Erythrobacteraceae bacterium E2-1 Yellow Sea]